MEDELLRLRGGIDDSWIIDVDYVEDFFSENFHKTNKLILGYEKIAIKFNDPCVCSDSNLERMMQQCFHCVYHMHYMFSFVQCAFMPTYEVHTAPVQNEYVLKQACM